MYIVPCLMYRSRTDVQHKIHTLLLSISARHSPLQQAPVCYIRATIVMYSSCTFFSACSFIHIRTLSCFAVRSGMAVGSTREQAQVSGLLRPKNFQTTSIPVRRRRRLLGCAAPPASSPGSSCSADLFREGPSDNTSPPAAPCCTAACAAAMLS